MKLKKLSYDLSVCKLKSEQDFNINEKFYFISKTDEEVSLVCLTEDRPVNTIEFEDEWKAFKIQGVLDFSLIGILSKISTILADNNIGIFAVSTFNTDYILVKNKNFEKALNVLEKEGYEII